MLRQHSYLVAVVFKHEPVGMLYCLEIMNSGREHEQFRVAEGTLFTAGGTVHWQNSGAKEGPSASQLFLGIWVSTRVWETQHSQSVLVVLGMREPQRQLESGNLKLPTMPLSGLVHEQFLPAAVLLEQAHLCLAF